MERPEEPRRALIAEDDDELAKLLVDVLTADGFDVVSVRSATTLRDTLSMPQLCGRFDIVVSDVRMPGLSGLDVLASLPRAARPPVILVTGIPTAAVVRAAGEHGATAVVAKPFDVQALRALVRRTVDATPPRSG